MNFLVNDLSVGLERSDWQAHAQSLHALGGVRFELPQPDGMTIDANGIFSPWAHFDGGVTDKPCGQSRRPCATSLSFGSAQTSTTFMYEGGSD